jgi:hypothetical protein
MTEIVYGKIQNGYYSNTADSNLGIVCPLFWDPVESILNGLSSDPHGLSGVRLESFSATVAIRVLNCASSYSNYCAYNLLAPVVDLILVAMDPADKMATASEIASGQPADLEDIFGDILDHGFLITVLKSGVAQSKTNIIVVNNVNTHSEFITKIKFTPSKEARKNNALFVSDEHLVENGLRSYVFAVIRFQNQASEMRGIGISGSYQLKFNRFTMKPMKLKE